jgi:methylated-DNA-[protein]-cysteine S-methyltransferase
MSERLSHASTVIVLNSRFGWFGVAGDASAVVAVAIGHPSAAAAREQLSRECRRAPHSLPPLLTRAAERIARYFDGEPLDLSDLPIRTERQTPFQQRVRQALRQVRYGQTVSYAELARRAGAPGAARAVGSVMASNPLPLLIPCHRVIGAGGRLGGFSAPQGVALKRALLAMEAGEPLPPDILSALLPLQTARAITHLR